MTAKVRLDLTDDDRTAVATGNITIADLAALRGVSRQAVQQAFRRRNWATTPSAAEAAGKAPQPAASARAAASSDDRAPGDDASPEAADGLSALLDQLGAGGDDDDDVRVSIADHARRAIATNALLTLSQATNLLSQPRVAPGALKAVSQAQLAAVDQLKSLGLLGKDLNAIAIPGGMTLRVVEMTASEVEAARAETESDFRNAFGGSADLDDGDDLDDRPPVDIVAAVPQRSTENADVDLQATDHRGTASDVLRSPRMPLRASSDFASLRARLIRSIRNRGRATWRTMAVAHGLEGPRDGDEIAEALISAAGNDDALARAIEAKLNEFD